MKKWLAEQKKSMKESSSFKYELLIKFVSFYHKINCIFSYCFFIFSYPFSWQNSFTFFENKKNSNRRVQLTKSVAISGTVSSAQEVTDKKWENLLYPRVCPLTLAMKSHLQLEFLYRLCMKEDKSFVLANCSVWSVSFSADNRSKFPVILEAEVPFCNYRIEFFYQHWLQEIPFKCSQNSYWCMVFGLWSWQGICCNLITLTFV